MATTGSDEKNTLYSDKNQSLYTGCPEKVVDASYRNTAKPNVMFL